MHFIISFWSLYLKKDRKPIHNVIYQSAYCMKLPIKKNALLTLRRIVTCSSVEMWGTSSMALVPLFPYSQESASGQQAHRAFSQDTSDIPQRKKNNKSYIYY